MQRSDSHSCIRELSGFRAALFYAASVQASGCNMFSVCMQPPLGYVAPELANADGQTAASSISSAADIFSLGTTLSVALRSSQPPCEQTPMCNAACGCVGKSELAVSNCKLEIQACLCSMLCLRGAGGQAPAEGELRPGGLQWQAGIPAHGAHGRGARLAAQRAAGHARAERLPPPARHLLHRCRLLPGVLYACRPEPNSTCAV